MSEYVYLQDDEQQIYDARSLPDMLPEIAAQAKPATLVFSLDGARGHYLSADFIAKAASVLGEHELSPRENTRLTDAVGAAEAYHEHNGGQTCGLCRDCEFVYDDVTAVESILWDHGYVTVWDDGVQVFKIGNADCTNCGHDHDPDTDFCIHCPCPDKVDAS